MDCLILCSGFAKRLEPISEFIPKSLLHINGKPIIDHILERVIPLNLNRIIISTNKRFEKQFEYWLEFKRLQGNKNLELLVEPSNDNAEKFGAVKGIEYDMQRMGIESDLLIIAGDNYFTFGLGGLMQKFDNVHGPVVALYDINSIDDARMFGVVKLSEDGRIVGFEEKPEKPKSTLISTGIYVYPKKDLGLLTQYLDGGGNPDGIGYFVEWLIKNTLVSGYVYKDGGWFDIGTITTYRKLFYTYL